MQGTKSHTKSPPEPRPRRWTRKEWYLLGDLGFFRDERVELIEGEIIRMPPMMNPHAVANGLTVEALRTCFGPSYWIRDQLPLHFGSRSEPQPDVAVVPGTPRDYQDHPTTALLVVEISITSLRFDRGRKAQLYARAGITDYWLINLVDNQLEILRDPQPDPRKVGRYTYATKTIHKVSDFVSPLAAPNTKIAVKELLP
jgi:Uma2 family endonuclease